MRSHRLLAPLVLSIPLAVASPAAAADHTVNVVNVSFQPATLQINPGDRVIWSFQEEGHTTTSRSGQAERWNSGPDTSPVGATFSHTFDTPGRYQYICIPHQFYMKGVVQVGQDEAAKTYSRFRQTRRGNSLRVSFRLAEPAEVTVKLRGPIRRMVRRRLEAGRRSFALSRLREGRYRTTVTFVDDFDKRSTARARATIG
jgi:plastocyanin